MADWSGSRVSNRRCFECDVLANSGTHGEPAGRDGHNNAANRNAFICAVWIMVRPTLDERAKTRTRQRAAFDLDVASSQTNFEQLIMKNQKSPSNHRHALQFAGLLSALVVLAGCETARRIVWSPDGSRAAVLAGQGLYLADSAGNLSGLLVSNATDAAWFSDSQRLAFVRSDTYTNWTDLAAVLPSETQQAVQKLADVLLTRIQSGTPQDKLNEGLNPEQRQMFDAGLLYLSDKHGTELRKAITDKTNEVQKAELMCLQLARVSGDSVELGKVLVRELAGMVGTRISPDGKFIAYAAGADSVLHLSVVPVDGAQPARTVDKRGSGYMDWSPDARSLVYIKAVDENSEDALIGSLGRRLIVSEAGSIELTNNFEDFAGLMFDGLGRVRCLQDGRILFSSTEIQLPATAKDMPQRQQLFALDPERQATITPLIPRGVQESVPANLGYFEVSPDEKQIVVGGDKSQVVIFTLASGDVTVVQPDIGGDLKILPSWRSTNQVSYGALSEPDKEGKRKAEVALWQPGQTNIVNLLSTNWPAAIRKGWLD